MTEAPKHSAGYYICETGTGQPTPISGKYEQLGASGQGTGIFRFLTKGKPTPPGTVGAASFRLVQQVETTHTTAASSAAIAEIMVEYEQAMRDLAKD